MAFIVVMIASLAAVGLAPGLGSTGGSSPAPIFDEDTPVPVETPTGLTFDGPGKTIDATKPHRAIIQTDKGDIEIELNTDAPGAVNSFGFLAGAGFYNGLEFFWVKPDFTAQAGDPTCESSDEFTCTGAGGPGYDLAREGNSTTVDRWTMIAPVISRGSDQVHGSQFVIALGDELEFEGTVLGQVVKGQEILEALEERAPCFGSEASESCQTENQMPAALTIEDVQVQPA